MFKEFMFLIIQEFMFKQENNNKTSKQQLSLAFLMYNIYPPNIGGGGKHYISLVVKLCKAIYSKYFCSDQKAGDQSPGLLE